jgi:hypothetical protein
MLLLKGRNSRVRFCSIGLQQKVNQTFRPRMGEVTYIIPYQNNRNMSIFHDSLKYAKAYNERVFHSAQVRVPLRPETANQILPLGMSVIDHRCCPQQRIPWWCLETLGWQSRGKMKKMQNAKFGDALLAKLGICPKMEGTSHLFSVLDL